MAAVGLLGRVVPGDVTVVVVIADGVEEGDAEFADQRAVFREPEAVEVHVLVEDHVADRQPVDPAAAEFGDGFREVGDERFAAARERRLRNHQAAGVVDLDVGRGQQHVFVRAGCRQREVVAVAAGVEQVVELRDGSVRGGLVAPGQGDEHHVRSAVRNHRPDTLCVARHHVESVRDGDAFQRFAARVDAAVEVRPFGKRRGVDALEGRDRDGGRAEQLPVCAALDPHLPISRGERRRELDGDARRIGADDGGFRAGLAFGSEPDLILSGEAFARDGHDLAAVHGVGGFEPHVAHQTEDVDVERCRAEELGLRAAHAPEAPAAGGDLLRDAERDVGGRESADRQEGLFGRFAPFARRQGERVALGELQHPEGHFAFVVELVGVVHQRDDEVVLARGLLLRFVRIGASGEQRSAGQCSGGKQSV